MTLRRLMGAGRGGLSRRRFLAGTGAAGWCAGCAWIPTDETQATAQPLANRPAMSAPTPSPARDPGLILQTCDQLLAAMAPDTLADPIPYSRGTNPRITISYWITGDYRRLPEEVLKDLPKVDRQSFSLNERPDVRVDIIRDTLSGPIPSTPRHIQMLFCFADHLFGLFRRHRLFHRPVNGKEIEDLPLIAITAGNYLHDRFRGAVTLGDGLIWTDLKIVIDAALSPYDSFLVLAHEFLHVVQHRFDGDLSNIVNEPITEEKPELRPHIYYAARGDMREGTARAFEEILVGGSPRFQRDATRWFKVPAQPLLTPAMKPYAPRPALYSSGLFFKYLADQAALGSSAESPETKKIAVLREFCRMPNALDLDEWRAAYLRLRQHGSFDRFAYLDRDSPAVLSDETLWGNFVLAVLLHGGQEPDPRFRFDLPLRTDRESLRYRFPDSNVVPFEALPSIRWRGSGHPGQGGADGSPPTGRSQPLSLNLPKPQERGDLVLLSAPAAPAPRDCTSPSAPSCHHPIGAWHAQGHAMEIRSTLVPHDMFEGGYRVPPVGLGIPSPALVGEPRPPLHALTPYSFLAWKVVLGNPLPGRMIRMGFRRSGGLEDALVQVVLLDRAGRVIDLMRCDGQPDGTTREIDRVIACRDASECLIVVAAREKSGNFRLRLSRVVERAYLFAATWNAVAGTSYATSPAVRAWTWRNPDLWIAESEVNLRLYNFGDRPASKTKVQFWTRNFVETDPGRRKVLQPEWQELTGTGPQRVNEFVVPTSNECAQRKLYRYAPDDSEYGTCDDYPYLEERLVKLPIRALDSSALILRATVTSPDNADPRAMEVLASPSGARPPRQAHVWTGDVDERRTSPEDRSPRRGNARRSL
jgi:hypothetical protein